MKILNISPSVLRRTQTMLLFIVALAAGLLTTNCADGQQAVTSDLVLGGDTPEEVHSRLQTAVENLDTREVAASLEPESLKLLTNGIYFMTSLTIAFNEEEAKAEEIEKMKAGFDEVAERHGLPSYAEDDEDPGAIDVALEGIDDHFALIELAGDLDELFRSIEDPDEENEFPIPTGELTDLEIDGDQASGTVGGEEIRFVHIDGRWFVIMPM